MLKRAFDIALSSIGLVILSPLFMVLVLLIKCDSAGPVFYRGIRAGRSGRPFRIMKFRSMVVDAERIGGPSTSSDDPRVTTIGAIMRKYKLDELPQLLNVLVGDMSLVGPRPEVLQEVELYDNRARRLLEVRPGITDYASIRFRDEGEILKGHPDPHSAYRLIIQPEKIRLGLQYVEHHNVWIDIKLILETLGSLFF